MAPSLYGWYREHLSWHWMFWNSAVIAPVMFVCIYFGIPTPPPRKKDGHAPPSFVGFLYLSAGLALMFAALQQGERLDWWRSGVFNALFWSGALFTICALIRRMRGPNWLVALPYLRQWNTVLLGSLLFWFRFTLVLTIILIHSRWPSVVSKRIRLTGHHLERCSAPAHRAYRRALMLRGLDPRLLFASGCMRPCRLS